MKKIFAKDVNQEFAILVRISIFVEHSSEK